MANSTSHLDLVSSSQAQKEVVVNAALDAASPAMLYGRRASTSAALTFGYYGGVVLVNGTPTQIDNGTVQLTASATNYVEANPVDGSVSTNTSGFTAGRMPLYQVVAGANTVNSYTDLRVFGASATGASAQDIADAIAAHKTDEDPHPGYLTQTEADARYLQSVGAQPFYPTAFYPGVPPASAKVTRIPVPCPVTFPPNFAGAYFTASVGSAGVTAFDVQKNGASIGAISVSGMTATFTTTGGVAKEFAAGDVLAIVGPATPDATLADPGFVLAGTR